jgi:cytochrome P450
MSRLAMAPFALAGPEELADPYPVYARYREGDPVHRADERLFYLFRYDDIASVLTSPDFGRDAARARAGLPAPTPAPPPLIPPEYPTLRSVVENWLVFLDPPRHTRLRALITRHFTARRVAALRPRIVDITRGLLAGVRAAPSMDVVADFAAPLPILVIGELLGIPPDRRDWVRACAVALQQANTSRGGPRQERFGAAEAAAGALSDYFHAEVARRRPTGPDDLTTALVRASLTDEEIVSTCVHLLTAGHETTTNLIAKSVLALLRHPTVRAWLSLDPSLMPAAVDELLRYDTPVQMVSRYAYRSTVIGGTTVPQGSRTMCVLGSANRDPAHFASPDELIVGRNTSRHAAFGMGIHYCLGAGLAHLEAEIGLAALLRDLPAFAAADEPAEYADDLVFHGPARLPLRTGA